MVKAYISIRYDDFNVRKLFKNLPKAIQESVGQGMYDMAKNYQRSLRYALQRNSIRFDGTIWGGIQAEKISNQKSIVTIPQEGIWLDSMDRHPVRLYPGRKITAWALQSHINPKIRATAKRGGVIWVDSHPWILEGQLRGDITRQSILQRAMDSAMVKAKNS
jgi:hypothetical protein